MTVYGLNNLPHDQDNQLQAAIKVLRGEWVEEAQTEESAEAGAAEEGAAE